MAITVANLQTNLAYRLGESSGQASTGSEGAKRLEWLNMAYFTVARRLTNWWWLEGTDTSNSNTGSTTGYAEPSDLREFIELTIDDTYYEQIPYKDHQIYENSAGTVSLPTLRRSFKYYRFGGRYYLIPEDGADSSTHTIKYWKRVTKRTSDSDTFLIPDEYLECLTAFAEARYWMSISQQAKAQAPFQEFEQILGELMKEQSRRGWGSSGYSIHDPEDQVI